MNARELASLLERKRYNVATEATFQADVEKLLTEHGATFKREYVLSPEDRVDFFVDDGVALELKVRGTPQSVNRQLQRYAQSPEVKAIVLLTSTSKLARGAPTWLSDKRVVVAYFLAGGF